MSVAPRMQPTVTALIPAYNAAPYIRAAVESVLAQTYPVQQIIIVDDGSTDDCRGALGELAERVTCLRIDNSGPAHARNVGLAASDAELIAFLDADDIWEPGKIAAQVADLVADPAAALTYCGKSLIDTAGKALGDFPQSNYPSGDIFLEMLSANYISTTSVVLARRHVLVALGGFPEGEQFRNCEDYELWLRIALAHRVASSPARQVRYRIHPGNATRNSSGRYKGMLAALESAESVARQRGRLDAAMTGKLAARRRDSHREFALAFFYEGRYQAAHDAAVAAHALGASGGAKFDLIRRAPVWLVRMVHRLSRALAGKRAGAPGATS
jgi:glycosyltransferase involved in cell wall biosynthesis